MQNRHETWGSLNQKLSSVLLCGDRVGTTSSSAFNKCFPSIASVWHVAFPKIKNNQKFHLFLTNLIGNFFNIRFVFNNHLPLISHDNPGHIETFSAHASRTFKIWNTISIVLFSRKFKLFYSYFLILLLIWGNIFGKWLINQSMKSNNTSYEYLRFS